MSKSSYGSATSKTTGDFKNVSQIIDNQLKNFYNPPEALGSLVQDEHFGVNLIRTANDYFDGRFKFLMNRAVDR